jgi:hypothetical protein
MKSLGWVVGALTMSALTSPAWARDDYGRYRGYGRDTFGIGYERGYHEGAKDGARDGRSRRGFNLYHDRTYRDGDQGYHSSYGPRREYSRAFRQGYEQGYRRGFVTRRDVYENGRNGRYDYRGDRHRYTDGRHHHEGRSGWCYERHDDGYWDDEDRVIYESPRRRY